MKNKTLLTLLPLAVVAFLSCSKKEKFGLITVGQPIDSLHHVVVYYNGYISNVEERNTTDDGYNLGLKYQCVEFVKRYYYQHFHHKMPDSYGHAKDFFNPKVKDGQYNKGRDLVQFTNPSKSKPKVSDLVIYDGHSGNPYGHVAIVSKVSDTEVEIIAQNTGIAGKTRETLTLVQEGQKWQIKSNRLLGWLRKK